MAQYNVPWSLRRFIPWYKHDYKQTSFDRQLSNTMSDVIDEMLSENRIEYDHTHLKGDGVPNFIPGKNYYINDPADSQIPGSVHGGPSRKVHIPARPRWGGIGSGSHRSRGSRSGYAGSDRPWKAHIGFGPNNCVEVEPDRPYRPKLGWRPSNRFGNQSPIGLTGTSRSVWGDRGGRGFGIFSSGRPRSSQGNPPGRGSKHVRSHPPTAMPPPAIPGPCPPPRSHHGGSRSQGHRSPPPIPGSCDPSHSQHNGRPPTRSSHHTAPGSPAPSRSRHSRHPTGSSHHTAPGSPAPSHSQHNRSSMGASHHTASGSSHHTTPRSSHHNAPGPSHHTTPGSHHSHPSTSHTRSRAPSQSQQHSRPPTAPESSHHTAPHSHHSHPPTNHTNSRTPSQSQPYCPPLAGSSHRSAPGSSSHHSAHSSHRSAPSSPPPAGSGSPAGFVPRSQRSRAGSGWSLPSRGRSGGSIKVNSRGMTWKDV